MIRLKFAFRTLFKTPLVTAIAIASLALGIGATAAIFSCFNDMLLQPLPVPEARSLVNLAAPGPKPGSQNCGQAGGCDEVFSYAMFRDLEKAQTVFTGIAAHVLFGVNVSFQGQTSDGQGEMVSGAYFPVLQLQPALGRLLNSNDDRLVGESAVVVLSHDFWTSRFAASPSVLNQGLIVNGHTLTIVGVAPDGFTGTTLGTRPDVFVPITLRAVMIPRWRGWSNRQSYWAYLFARLRPGVSLDSARATLGSQYHGIVNAVEAPLQAQMSDATMKRFRAKPLVMEPGGRGQSSVPDKAGAPLKLLLGVTGLVLLIACANIANLLLARSAARAGEMSIRLSLGASRAGLIGQLLTESLLLAICGGLVGLLVAHWTLVLILSLLPPEVARTLVFRIDTTVLLFAAALTIGTGLLFGLFPALHSTRPDILSALKGQSGQPSGARGAARFRMALATAQIALSMALLAASGLFVKSLLNVSRIDLGIKVEHLIGFTLSPQLNAYTPERTRLLYDRLRTELLGVPGVSGVTASVVPLLSGSNWGNDVSVQGFQSGPDVDSNSRFNEVAPTYFSTIGIPLVSGREFSPADTLGSAKVVIVNEAFAKKFGLGRDAVGKMMGYGRGNRSPLDSQIIGVARDAKYSEVKQTIPPLFFVSSEQDATPDSMTFYVRTGGAPTQAAPAITAVVKRLDPNLPISQMKTMPQQVRENTYLDRMMTTLSAAFAILATILAGVGLYGVLAYTVSQRTRELGLRMALGAPPSRVRAMILRQVGLMTIVGAAAGTAGAVAMGKGASAILYNMTAWDPVALSIATAVLAAVALTAGLVPAYRASRVDPMRALRYQ